MCGIDALKEIKNKREPDVHFRASLFSSSHDIFSSARSDERKWARDPVGLSVSDVGRHYKTASQSGSRVQFSFAAYAAKRKFPRDDDKGKCVKTYFSNL
ncbi:MAG TPA: hypothetical protein DCY07_01895 [Rhodospirillaceae bacterium]|nr:hypothetical protein [Rhodospirillaceae bacterium]